MTDKKLKTQNSLATNVDMKTIDTSSTKPARNKVAKKIITKNSGSNKKSTHNHNRKTLLANSLSIKFLPGYFYNNDKNALQKNISYSMVVSKLLQSQQKDFKIDNIGNCFVFNTPIGTIAKTVNKLYPKFVLSLKHYIHIEYYNELNDHFNDLTHSYLRDYLWPLFKMNAILQQFYNNESAPVPVPASALTKNSKEEENKKDSKITSSPTPNITTKDNLSAPAELAVPAKTAEPTKNQENNIITKKESLNINFSQAGKIVLKELVNNYGFASRLPILQSLRALTDNDKKQLRDLGINFGAFSLYQYQLLKPKSSALTSLLASLQTKNKISLKLNISGLTCFNIDNTIPKSLCIATGFLYLPPFAIRMDIIEKLNRLIRTTMNDQSYFLATEQMRSLLGSTSQDLFKVLLQLRFEQISVDKIIFDQLIDKSKNTSTIINIEEPKINDTHTDSSDIHSKNNFLIWVKRRKIKSTYQKYNNKQNSTNNSIAHNPKNRTALKTPNENYTKQIAGKNQPATLKHAHKGAYKKSMKKFNNKRPNNNRPLINVTSEDEKAENNSPFAILKNMKIENNNN